MVETVGGKQLDIREEPRRAGDPAYLVARAGAHPRGARLGTALRRLEGHRRLARSPGSASSSGSLGRELRVARRVCGAGRTALRATTTRRCAPAPVPRLYLAPQNR